MGGRYGLRFRADFASEFNWVRDAQVAKVLCLTSHKTTNTTKPRQSPMQTL